MGNSCVSGKKQTCTRATQCAMSKKYLASKAARECAFFNKHTRDSAVSSDRVAAASVVIDSLSKTMPTTSQLPHSSSTMPPTSLNSLDVSCDIKRSSNNTRCEKEEEKQQQQQPVGKLQKQKTQTNHNHNSSKVNYVEIYLIERKRYMQRMGVYEYNSQTILPPPVLRDLDGNGLFQRRRRAGPAEKSIEEEHAGIILPEFESVRIRNNSFRDFECEKPHLFSIVNVLQVSIPTGDSGIRAELSV